MPVAIVRPAASRTTAEISSFGLMVITAEPAALKPFGVVPKAGSPGASGRPVAVIRSLKSTVYVPDWSRRGMPVTLWLATRLSI